MRFLSRFQEYFVPVSLAMDPEGLRRGRILVNAGLFLIGYVLLFAGLFLISQHSHGFWVCAFTLLSTLTLLWYYKSSGRIRLIGHLFVLNLFLFSAWFSTVLGGVLSPQMAWFLSLPITAFLIVGQGAGYLWTLTTVAGLLAFFFFPATELTLISFEEEGVEALHFVGLAGLVLYFLLIVDVYEKGRVNAMAFLDKAQRKIMSKNKMLEQQKRAIKSQNKATFEQNNVLEKQYQEIVNINSSLENIIHERTFKLEEALHDLDTFLYESSHALRRPVSSILGLLQVIRLETSPEVREELTLRLEETVKGMDSMLQKLIFINTINQDHDFDEELRLEAIVNRLIEKYQHHVLQRNIQFNINIHTNGVKGSPHLMTVLLDNLLENAIMFADSTGRRAPQVEVSIKETDGELTVIIGDNGIGIPAHLTDRIFDLFYRASIISTGNGLGLYMVKKVVDCLNGTIDVQSEERAFTTFKVRIPLDQSSKKKAFPTQSLQLNSNV